MNNFKEISKFEIDSSKNKLEGSDDDFENLFILDNKKSKGNYNSNSDSEESTKSNNFNNTNSFSDISESEETVCNTNESKKTNSTEIFEQTNNGIRILESMDECENSDDKTLFTYFDLKNKCNPLDIFYNYDLIVFTDDNRIESKRLIGSLKNRIKKKFKFISNFFNGIKMVKNNDFPGIVFVSFESLNFLKKLINQHNKILQDSDKDNDLKKMFKYQICFDEGDYYKNMVYKKLQINDKFLFVPYSKFQLKLTEYKLRSFCQIMEELGANEIEIEFNHSNLSKSSKKIELKADEFNYIAGTLGFSANKTMSSNEEITYKLIYPKSNTIILNEKKIIKNIENGDYIINKKNFDSNLELQYIITSRCRHFIENYSTVFTLDNSMNYDQKMISKLKMYNFNCGFEFNKSLFKNLKISITTKVKFCNQSNLNSNLLGNNVNLDPRGFNYLLGTIKDQEQFIDNGIFKIISFIHKYIEKIIKKEPRNYQKIKKIIRIINKEFSFHEYKDLLLDYFKIDSQWVNFLNYIDVLKFKSVSFNKLGFLILMSQDNVLPYSKNIKIINFIKHLCSKENCEDKFWEMLDPSNYFLIINKLDKKYNLIRKFNWFNMEKLLKDVKSYSDSVYLSQNTKDLEIEYRLIFNNLRLGFIDLQFENNMKPFVKKLILEKFKERIEVIKEISNDEPFFNNYIYESINARHFKTHVLNTIEKLKKLINHKFDQLEEFCKVFNDLIEFLDKSKIINDSERAPSDHDNKNCSYTKLINLLSSKEFKSKYPNCFKKIYFILETCNKSNNDEDINLTLKNFFCINGSKDSNKKKSLDIITKLILFDLHMNDQEIMLNNLTSLGFNTINSYTMNFDEDKLLFLKLKFLIGFVRFLIHQIDKNLMKKLNTMNIFKISRIEFDFNKIKNQKLESIGFNLTKKDITFLEKLRFTYNYKDLVYLVREFFKNYLDLSVQEELLYLL